MNGVQKLPAAGQAVPNLCIFFECEDEANDTIYHDLIRPPGRHLPNCGEAHVMFVSSICIPSERVFRRCVSLI